MLLHLNLFVLKTKQPEKLAKQYAFLGFVFDYHQHGNGPLHYSAIIGSVVFEIYPLPSSQTVDTSTRLGFAINDLKLALEKIRTHFKIVTEAQQTDWGFRAVVEDLDGRKVELIQK